MNPALGRLVRLFPLVPLVLAACGGSADESAESATPEDRPNFLWIVWDTVRADHLSLYGYERETTPFLDAWSKGARVFQDSLSTAGYTLPSHASMFTGLLPSEHCTHNQNQRLDDAFVTVAELLRDAGYRTFLYSENPHVSAEPARNLAQGFEAVRHPWSPEYKREALAIVRAKLPSEDRSSELRERLDDAERGRGSLTAWNIKAAGELAERATRTWLAESDADRPFFVLINYMEAHRPYIPPRRFRERLMSPEDVAKSYEVDRSWLPLWEYNFGLREYTSEELALTAATYDAALAELDELLRGLLGSLEAGGYLENTVVILTSDHGEHLGEQHLLDHQYSVYQPLLRVPLIVHYPKRFAPGRETRPVANFDLFPTILELAGVEPPADLVSRAVSLLRPAVERARLAEEPALSRVGIESVRQRHPDWDPSPYPRRLQALVEGPHKIIRSSDGRREVFDLGADPGETDDRAESDAALAGRLEAALERYTASLARCAPSAAKRPGAELTAEQRQRLQALGYAGDDDDPEKDP